MPITRRDHNHSDGRRNKESPTHLLQWRRLGENNNISGYACSGELFAFLGVDENAKSNILKTIAKGQQTDDIPEEIRNEFMAENRLRLPMLPDSRSLNFIEQCRSVTV